jgi:hypothetical protein
MKPINKKNFEHYLIDIHGNVYSTLHFKHGKIFMHTPKILKSFPNKNTKYHQIVLQNKKDGIKPTNFYVHRLVAETYIPNTDNLPEVNHIIADKNDNSVGNLEWVTKKYNIKHKILYGKPIITKLDLLLKNKKLIDKGINHYEWNKDIEHLKKIWKVTSANCYTILKNNGVQFTRYDLPNKVLELVIEEIKNYKKTTLGNKFIQYIKSKYKVKFTYHMLFSIKRNFNLES